MRVEGRRGGGENRFQSTFPLHSASTNRCQQTHTHLFGATIQVSFSERACNEKLKGKALFGVCFSRKRILACFFLHHFRASAGLVQIWTSAKKQKSWRTCLKCEVEKYYIDELLSLLRWVGGGWKDMKELLLQQGKINAAAAVMVGITNWTECFAREFAGSCIR